MMSTPETHNFENSFSGRLLRLLEEKGLSQDGLRLLLGSTSTGLVSNWIKRNRPPNSETLVKLAKVLDTTPHYLLHGEIEPEGDGRMNEGDDPIQVVAHWRGRALTAERKLEKITSGLSELQSAAGELAEKAGTLIKIGHGAEKTAYDVATEAIAKRVAELRRQHKGTSSSVPSEVKAGVAKVAEKLSREGRK